MKLTDLNENAEGNEIVLEQQEKKEIKFIGSQRYIPGLILWEYNPISKTLVKATYKSRAVIIKWIDQMGNYDYVIQNKVSANESCRYFQALNMKNAIKHCLKHGFIDDARLLNE
jgi:hypothetical protein